MPSASNRIRNDEQTFEYDQSDPVEDKLYRWFVGVLALSGCVVVAVGVWVLSLYISLWYVWGMVLGLCLFVFVPYWLGSWIGGVVE